MLTQEENDLLTRTGPGTPAGNLLRRYWQPAALSEELPDGGPPLPVRLLGEDLVLFRNDQGRPGLLGLHCSHRGADLSYGRLEDGGLRCIYHGWLYELEGRCLEQPGEPPGSTFNERILHKAYPCLEKAGIIFAYLGPGEPPLLPAYEPLNVPDELRSVTKVFQDSNYLQAVEGQIDPVHVSFLHRLALESDVNQGLLARQTVPQIEAELTDFGIRVYAVRPMADQNYVRLTNFIFPNAAAVGGGADGYGLPWHVPIDDTHHWRFGISFNRFTPIDPDIIRRGQNGIVENYRLIPTKENRYLQDRASMKTWAFSGMGRSFLIHDTCATEGAGPIQDRTQEHLGSTDRAIVAMRQALMRAIKDVEEGRDPPHVIRDPAANTMPEIYVRNDLMLPASVDWRHFWDHETARSLLTTTGRQPA